MHYRPFTNGRVTYLSFVRDLDIGDNGKGITKIRLSNKDQSDLHKTAENCAEHNHDIPERS